MKKNQTKNWILQKENYEWSSNLVQLPRQESPLTDHISCKRNIACGRPEKIISSFLWRRKWKLCEALVEEEEEKNLVWTKS